MATAKQKAEWSRFADLLNLVHNRTGFGEEFQPTVALDWMPAELVTKADRQAMIDAQRKAREATIVKVPFSAIVESFKHGGNRQ